MHIVSQILQSSWVLLLDFHISLEVVIRTHLPPPGGATSLFPKCQRKKIKQACVYLSAFVHFKPVTLRVAKEIFFLKCSRIQAIKCFSNIKQFHTQNLLPLMSLSGSRKHFPFMLICYLKCFLKWALSVLFVSRWQSSFKTAWIIEKNDMPLQEQNGPW